MVSLTLVKGPERGPARSRAPGSAGSSQCIAHEAHVWRGQRGRVRCGSHAGRCGFGRAGEPSGVRGIVLSGGDVGGVGAPAAGQGDVEGFPGRLRGDDGVGGVCGDALGPVRRGRVTQIQSIGHRGGGRHDGCPGFAADPPLPQDRGHCHRSGARRGSRRPTASPHRPSAHQAPLHRTARRGARRPGNPGRLQHPERGVSNRPKSHNTVQRSRFGPLTWGIGRGRRERTNNWVLRDARWCDGGDSQHRLDPT
jgi:hypothetical protein